MLMTEKVSHDAKDILGKVFDEGEDIFENDSDENKDILEEVFNDGDHIFESIFDDAKDMLEKVSPTWCVSTRIWRWSNACWSLVFS